MKFKYFSSAEKAAYNKLVDHPLQSWGWGEFKELTGQKAVRIGIFNGEKIVNVFQVLIKSLAKLSLSVGYLPKSGLPDEQMIEILKQISKENSCIFIKLEPDFIQKKWQARKGEIDKESLKENKIDLKRLDLQPAFKSLFDPYSFELDLSQNEDELLTNMHPKTRYNIKVAQKHGVVVEERSDEKGLEIFIKLFEETLKRQRFYMHSPDYFRKLWSILGKAKIAKILLAKYRDKILNAWILFVWKDRLFYPYGASSSEYRNLMASNLICWEAIKLGKKLGLKKFDLWGGLGPNPDIDHPWFGFHRFKIGYSPDVVEYAGSWDLVMNNFLYKTIEVGDKIRWKLLHLIK